MLSPAGYKIKQNFILLKRAYYLIQKNRKFYPSFLQQLSTSVETLEKCSVGWTCSGQECITEKYSALHCAHTTKLRNTGKLAIQ